MRQRRRIRHRRARQHPDASPEDSAVKPVVHIAPQLPPAIDGVGDYCANLWRHWPQPQPGWTFLVARGADETRGVIPELDVREFGLNGDALAAALERTHADAIVLHYVGYAYQPKGIPVWLPGAIGRWKRARPGRRVVTMFHEMYARSSPLRSPFWVAPFARKIIAGLVALSDIWITNCDRYHAQLMAEFNARAELGRMLPIPSNIPVTAPVGPSSRSALRFRIALFGLARTRLWALARHGKLLHAMQERGLIEHITLLGKRPEGKDEAAWKTCAARIGEVAWRSRFDLSAGEISDELAEHDLGLIANEPDILTKSGVFAALTAHGVVPIVAGPTQAALPVFAAESVILNDDGPGTIAALLKTLRDRNRIQHTRDQLLAATAPHLAWPRITSRWHELLERLASDAQPRPRAVNIPILTSA
jgi:hypothetical protein